jgi:hypothetical protein
MLFEAYRFQSMAQIQSTVMFFGDWLGPWKKHPFQRYGFVSVGFFPIANIGCYDSPLPAMLQKLFSLIYIIAGAIIQEKNRR